MSVRQPRPGLGAPRRARLIAVAAVLLVALGLAAVIGGFIGPRPAGESPAPSQPSGPAFSDLPMVTVPPSTPSASAGAGTSTSPQGSPSEAPSATASPAVAPGIRASRIRIARLGIDLSIIDGDGIDAPIGKAAHFPGSAWPDGGSNIYIYGHARTGMFLTLWKARVGDQIVLDLVDGTSRTYVVSTILPKVAWDAVTYLAPTPTEQLSVQTSTSYYPTAPRFLVIAVPVP